MEGKMVTLINSDYSDLHGYHSGGKNRRDSFYSELRALAVEEAAVADLYIGILTRHYQDIEPHFNELKSSMDRHMDNAYYWRTQLPERQTLFTAQLDADLADQVRMMFNLCEKGAKLDLTAALWTVILCEKRLLVQYGELEKLARKLDEHTVTNYIHDFVVTAAKKNLKALHALVEE